MSDLTIFPADIAEMSVSQLAALPAAQKHEIDKNLEAAIDWLKKARTKFDAALDQCYGEQARAALHESGRDFGTAHSRYGYRIYAAQVAIYQAYLELHEHPAIFTALNADTMNLYTELVPFDAALAQRMSDRAVKVITATEAGELLPRAFHDSTHFECRMCAWQDRCWRKKA